MRLSLLSLDVCIESLHGDVDLPRFCFFGFRNSYLEYTVFVGGLNAVVFYGFRKSKGSYELSIKPFYTAILDAISWLNSLPFAHKRQCSVFDFEIKILLFHPRKLGAK